MNVPVLLDGGKVQLTSGTVKVFPDLLNFNLIPGAFVVETPTRFGKVRRTAHSADEGTIKWVLTRDPDAPVEIVGDGSIMSFSGKSREFPRPILCAVQIETFVAICLRRPNLRLKDITPENLSNSIECFDLHGNLRWQRDGRYYAVGLGSSETTLTASRDGANEQLDFKSGEILSSISDK
jgi:hypothetical protein